MRVLFVGGPKHGEWIKVVGERCDQTILVPHLEKPHFVSYHEEQQHTLGVDWKQHSYTLMERIDRDTTVYEYEGLGDENVYRRAKRLDDEIEKGYLKNRNVERLISERSEITYEWGI